MDFHFRTNFVLVTIIATTLTLASAETIILPTSVHAQTSPPSGSQLAALTDRWWQLILSTDITAQANPFTFPFPCSQQTQGNTLFLVGQGPSNSVSAHGTCIISPQTSVLFPLINGFDVDCQNIHQQKNKPLFMGLPLCTFVKQTPVMGQPFGPLRTLASVGSATNLAAFLDGIRLQSVRVQSPPGGFEITLAPHDVFGFNLQSLHGNGPVTLHGVADGFWVLLPSLPVGQHSLTFGGCLSSSCQTNTYTIIVR